MARGGKSSHEREGAAGCGMRGGNFRSGGQRSWDRAHPRGAPGPAEKNVGRSSLVMHSGRAVRQMTRRPRSRDRGLCEPIKNRVFFTVEIF